MRKVGMRFHLSYTIILGLLMILSLPACAARLPAALLPLPSQSLTPQPSGTPSPSLTPSLLLEVSPVSTRPASPSSTSPAALPTPPACSQKGGRIETGQLATDLLPAPLDYRVYLPPCYDQHTDRSYPVLYLVHGQSYTDDQWERLGVRTAADRLISMGEASPFLIVMPRDRSWQEPTQDLFGQAVVDDLIPWMDANYRTLAERESRSLGGLSRGGAWALHMGLRYWERFGSFGMHSGFAFHSDVPYIKIWLDGIPADQYPRIYIDIGDNDRPEIEESAVWFEGLLIDRGIPHEWHLFSGYHEEVYWQAHVEGYLRWYTEVWK